MAHRYAELSDLVALGIVAASVSGVDLTRVNAALNAAADLMDGYLRQRGVTLPLTAWGDAWTECNCRLAAETVLAVAGHNPQMGRDDVASVRAARSIAWLEKVALGQVNPGVTDSTPTDTSDADGVTFSAGVIPRRNWNRR